MDISLFQTFLEVAKTRNFARAADNLYVTSAAVSARIKLLEANLGVVLLSRDRGNMQLTHEGERLLPLAESLTNMWARTQAEMKQGLVSGARIHIGATASLWQFGLQEKLKQIRSRFPELALQAEAHSHESLLRMLIDQRLDLVLLPDPQSNAGFTATEVGAIKLVMASRDHTTLAEAASTPYIHVDWGTQFEGFYTRKLGGRVTSTLHVNLVSIAIAMMESDGGAAYIPEGVASSHEHLKIVSDAPVFTRPVFACYRQQNPGLDLIREIVEILQGLTL